MTLRLTANVALGATAALAFGAAVAAIGPKILPFQALPVLTGSMEPAIPTGSLAIVMSVRGDELAVGDVITFHHPRGSGGYVTHRIVAIKSTGADRVFTTKGDANALADAWQVSGTGSGWRYAFGVPFVGAAIVAIAGGPMRMALYVIPLVALAVISLFEIWRPRPKVSRPLARPA